MSILAEESKKDEEPKKEEETKNEVFNNDEVNKMEQAMKFELSSLGAKIGELEKIRLIKMEKKSRTKKKKNLTPKMTKNIKLVFKIDLATNAPTYSNGTQMFSAFKTLKGQAILAWVTKAKTIELYDLEKILLLKQ